MKHLSATPPPSREASRRSRSRSTWSSCARSRRIRPRGTRAPRRWTPTSSASAAGSRCRARRRRPRRRCCAARRSPTARRRRSCRRLAATQGAAAAAGRADDYFDYDSPPRRRSIWPWLLAVLLVAARCDRRLLRLPADPGPAGPDAAGRRAVPRRDHARRTPSHDHPRRRARDGSGRRATSTASRTTASRRATSSTRTRTPGDRVGKGSFVDIWVSTGKAQVVVPDVVGETSDDAVAALTRQNLVADVHKIASSKPAGHGDRAGSEGRRRRCAEKTKVRINVSSGPKPIGIPDVRGQLVRVGRVAAAGAGFAVARQDVDSDQPRGDRDRPEPCGEHVRPRKGSTVTLTVSKGPTDDRRPERRRARDAQTAREPAGGVRASR